MPRQQKNYQREHPSKKKFILDIFRVCFLKGAQTPARNGLEGVSKVTPGKRGLLPPTQLLKPPDTLERRQRQPWEKVSWVVSSQRWLSAPWIKAGKVPESKPERARCGHSRRVSTVVDVAFVAGRLHNKIVWMHCSLYFILYFFKREKLTWKGGMTESSKNLVVHLFFCTLFFAGEKWVLSRRKTNSFRQQAPGK